MLAAAPSAGVHPREPAPPGARRRSLHACLASARRRPSTTPPRVYQDLDVAQHRPAARAGRTRARWRVRAQPMFLRSAPAPLGAGKTDDAWLHLAGLSSTSQPTQLDRVSPRSRRAPTNVVYLGSGEGPGPVGRRRVPSAPTLARSWDPTSGCRGGHPSGLAVDPRDGTAALRGGARQPALERGRAATDRSVDGWADLAARPLQGRQHGSCAVAIDTPTRRRPLRGWLGPSEAQELLPTAAAAASTSRPTAATPGGDPARGCRRPSSSSTSRSRRARRARWSRSTGTAAPARSARSRC